MDHSVKSNEVQPVRYVAYVKIRRQSLIIGAKDRPSDFATQKPTVWSNYSSVEVFHLEN